MLLAIDVGNTSIVLGVFAQKRLLDHWRLQTVAGRTGDEYGVLTRALFAASKLEPEQVEAVIISSVVPTLQATLTQMSQRTFGREPLFVGPGMKTGMPILYDNPREVGADRIVNAVAAYERFRSALVVVDFGTATIFDVVSAKGEYLGGVICPGVTTAMEALFQNASKLPRIEFKRPGRVIGRDTVASMQSGLVYGFVGLVDGLCARIAAELGGPVKVVATGGLAPLLAGESRAIEVVDEFLPLDGLRILYERNLPS